MCLCAADPLVSGEASSPLYGAGDPKNFGGGEFPTKRWPGLSGPGHGFPVLLSGTASDRRVAGPPCERGR